MKTTTVLDTLTTGADYLARHGVPSPRLNMEHLVAHVLGCNRMQLYLDFDRPLTEGQLTPLRQLLKRRSQREPLQHLLGSVEFLGRGFKTDRRALIPRPETETLVERLLKDAADQGEPPRQVLDMGAGSGVIGLTLAAEWGSRGTTVTLVDVSPEALDLARENAAALGLPDAGAEPGSLRFIQGDLWSAIESGGEFDLLVANLPYVADADLDRAEPELAHDPRLALAGGGADGTGVITRFLDGAAGHARPGARLALEIAMDQAAAVIALAEARGWISVESVDDLEGRPRFVFATRPA